MILLDLTDFLGGGAGTGSLALNVVTMKVKYINDPQENEEGIIQNQEVTS